MAAPKYGKATYAVLSAPNTQNPAIYGGYSTVVKPNVRWNPGLRTYEILPKK